MSTRKYMVRDAEDSDQGFTEIDAATPDQAGFLFASERIGHRQAVLVVSDGKDVFTVKTEPRTWHLVADVSKHEDPSVA